MPHQRAVLGLGAAATVGLGTPFLLIAVAQEAMPTSLMALSRLALGALVLVALLAAGGRVGRELAGLRRRPLAVLTVAVTAGAAPQVLIGAAERHVPSSTAAVILATTPLWIAVIESFTPGGERLGWRRWSALPLAIGGAALACRAALPAGAWAWCLLPAGAAVSYAAANVTVRRRLAHVRPLAVAAAELVLASAMLLPPAVLDIRRPGEVRWLPVAWIAVAVAGVGCSGLGWWANTALVQRVGAVRASTVSYSSVVLSVGLGASVRDEPFTWPVAAGTAVLIASVVLLLRAPVPARRAGGSSTCWNCASWAFSPDRRCTPTNCAAGSPRSPGMSGR